LRKVLLILPVVILISGCANTRTYWVHNSKPQQYTYRDIADCEVSANSGSSYSYRGDDEVLHAINEWQSIDRRTSIFNNCMMGKGYYKVTERITNKNNDEIKSLGYYLKNDNETKSEKKRKQKVIFRNDENITCNEMPMKEWRKHNECMENYNDLDDLPLESLKYQRESGEDEDERKRWQEVIDGIPYKRQGRFTQEESLMLGL